MLRKKNFFSSFKEPVKFVVPPYEVSTNEIIDFVSSDGTVISQPHVTHHQLSDKDFVDVTDVAENYTIQSLQGAGIQLKTCPTFVTSSLDELSDTVDPLYDEILDTNTNVNDNI